MDILKKIWPIAFKERKEVSQLVISLIIQALLLIVGVSLIGLVVGFATMLVAWIPVIGALIVWLVNICFTLIDLYIIANIVFTILSYCKVLK